MKTVVMPAVHSDQIDVPRAPLVAIAVLLVLTLTAVATWRWLGPAQSPFAPSGPVLAEQALHFDDRADGAIVVRSAGDGQVRCVIEPGADPFVRGALRALVRERRAMGAGGEAPFRLVAWANGRLTLLDTATQRRLDIESFGPTQSAAFARLLAISNGRRGAASERPPT